MAVIFNMMFKKQGYLAGTKRLALCLGLAEETSKNSALIPVPKDSNHPATGAKVCVGPNWLYIPRLGLTLSPSLAPTVIDCIQDNPSVSGL